MKNVCQVCGLYKSTMYKKDALEYTTLCLITYTLKPGDDVIAKHVPS